MSKLQDQSLQTCFSADSILQWYERVYGNVPTEQLQALTMLEPAAELQEDLVKYCKKQYDRANAACWKDQCMWVRRPRSEIERTMTRRLTLEHAALWDIDISSAQMGPKRRR